jgi:adiponectin receptor
MEEIIVQKKHQHCNGQIDQVPIHARSKYILGSYRMNFETHVDCIRSVFMLHNETINIWTHLLAAIYFVVDLFMFVKSETQLASLENMFILFCYASCILCMSASTWYHTHCAQSCPNGFACLLKYDLAGILTVTLAMYLSNICLLFAGPNNRLQSLYLALTIIAAIITALPLTVSHLSAWSRYAVIFFVLTYILPLSHFMAIATPDEIRIFSTPQIILSLLFIFIGAIFYFTHFPERQAPGRFDLFLHSHQIWHVLAFLGYQSAIEGMKRVHKIRTHQI